MTMQPPDTNQPLPEGESLRFAEGPLTIALQRGEVTPTNEIALWGVIRQVTANISFNAFDTYLKGKCQEREDPNLERSDGSKRRRPPQFTLPFSRLDAYELLKSTTHRFLQTRCGVADDLRQRRHVRRDHRRARGHRFERRQPEALVERREHEHRRQPIEGRERRVRDVPEEAHVRVQLEPMHQPPQIRVLRDLLADDDERVAPTPSTAPHSITRVRPMPFGAARHEPPLPAHRCATSRLRPRGGEAAVWGRPHRRRSRGAGRTSRPQCGGSHFKNTGAAIR